MKKRAFVRYSKNGKIVPGSLILTGGSYPQGPSTWKEVPADLCCETTYGFWRPTIGGQAGDGTILIDDLQDEEFTFVGPNDSEDDGWVYLSRYFSTETCLEIEYSYASFDGTDHDFPVYWTSPTEPTGIPGDTTNRITTNPEDGTWNVTVPAGEWFSIGLYSDDSCCGRGFLEIDVNVVDCVTVVEFQLANDNSAINSCNSLPATETYYSDTNDIGIGTYLYYDSALTNPVDDGWYASPFSGFTYEVSTGDGMINNAAAC